MIQQYCLDTSFFINSWRKNYPKAVFPAFWKAIEELIRDKVIISCEEVFHELQKKEDELSAWSVERRHIFEAPDDETIDEVIKLMTRFRNFGAAGGARNAADPWVIAHAARRKAVVVTDEQRIEGKPKPTKPPRIPNVCLELDMKCIGIVGFLGANGISF